MNPSDFLLDDMLGLGFNEETTTLDAPWIEVTHDGVQRWLFEEKTRVMGFETRDLKSDGYCHQLLVGASDQMANSATIPVAMLNNLTLESVIPGTYLALKLTGFRGEIRPVGLQYSGVFQPGARIVHRQSRVVPMTIGLTELPDIVAPPGQRTIVQAWPQRLFRVDLLYLDCDGLVIDLVKVGNQPQRIERGTPAKFYNENGVLAALQRALAKAFVVDTGKSASARLEELRESFGAVESADPGTYGAGANKGRAVLFDTAEVGMVITLELLNPTNKPIVVSGCYTGRTID